MLLEGIYYGRTPISRAYKDGQVIWSLGEDKDLVFNAAAGAQFIAQITPSALQEIITEYNLCLNSTATLNSISTGDSEFNQVILNDAIAAIHLQETFGLTPLDITFVFDVIGNTSVAKHPYYKCGIADRVSNTLSSDKSQRPTLHIQNSTDTYDTDFRLDKSQRPTGILNYEVSSNINTRMQKTATPSGACSTQFDMKATSLMAKSRFFLAYNRLHNNMAINLITDVSKIIEAHEQFTTTLYSVLQASSSQNADSDALLVVGTEALGQKDESKNIEINNPSAFSLQNLIQNVNSQNINTVNNMDISLKAESLPAKAQQVETNSISKFNIENIFRNRDSFQVAVEWAVNFDLNAKLNNPDSDNINSNSIVGLKPEIIGANLDSARLESNELININYNNQINSSPANNTLIKSKVQNLNASLLSGSPVHAFDFNGVIKNIDNINLRDNPATKIGFQDFGIIKADNNLKITDIHAINLAKTIESEISTSTLNTSAINNLNNIDNTFVSRIDQSLLNVPYQQLLHFSTSGQTNNVVNILIFPSLQEKFTSSVCVLNNTQLELYNTPLDTIIQKFLHTQANGMLIQSCANSSEFNTKLHSKNISSLNSMPRLIVSTANIQNTQKQLVTLTALKWEYPIQKETDLFISQAAIISPIDNNCLIIQ